MDARQFSLSLPGLTRQSILFARTLCEADGPAGKARGWRQRL